MRHLIFLFVLVFVMIGCSKKPYVLKVNFQNSSVPTPPDYSNIQSWASLPERADAADSVPLKSGLKNQQASAAVDYIVIGEGEITLRNLLEVLEADGDPALVAGIAFRQNGRIVKTARREFVESLDDL